MPTPDPSPYSDATLSPEQRAGDLAGRMALEDKVGLMFHTLTPMADPAEAVGDFGLPSLTSMIRNRRMNHFNVLGSASSGGEMARWQNAAQRIAMDMPLGVPITFSTDPRHASVDNPGTAIPSGPFSQWPDNLGLAAIGSPEVVQRFADIARQEYVAVGLRVALHPQVDLMTEPRWSRASGTFGEDAALTSRLVGAYIRGFQGAELGPESVATITKHFPGGGPQKDGEDPHFAYGREQVYPGGMFELHLQPFEAAIAAGGSQMMPYYGMPVGTQYDEVGFGYNRSVITGLLRQRYGFNGIVCTDWGLITDSVVMGTDLPARAWGVEHLTRQERIVKILDAGADQFGGELCTDVLLDVVRSGQVDEARLDVSVGRLLREKFRLGLFERPFVDEERAEIVVGRDDFRAAGLAAQRASLTLLTNGDPLGPTLPLRRGVKVYVEGLRADAVGAFGRAVAAPEDADIAIVRLAAPFEPRGDGFESLFHAGSLEFPQSELDRLVDLANTVPTVFDVYLDRPAVLTGLVECGAAVIVNYGCSDDALLSVLFGEHEPNGALPFDLPRSMRAVEAGREDVPFDTEDPLFRFGHGLRTTPVPE